MDINVTTNTLPPNIINKNYNIDESFAINPNVEMVEVNNNIKTDVPEKVMMDLKDVQNFLYMLIGSELRVESDKTGVGSTINKRA